MLYFSYSSFIEFAGSFAALIVALFVLVGLGLRMRDEHGAPMYLWSMMAFFGIAALDMLDSIAFGSPFHAPLALRGWQNVLLPGFIISIYFFVRGLSSPTPKLKQTDLIHLLPFFISLLCLLPQLILSGEDRQAPLEAGLSAMHLHFIEFGENGFWAVWIGTLFLYGGLCIRRLVRHKRNIRNLFSDLGGKDLFWLDMLVGLIFVLSGNVIVDELMQLMGEEAIRQGNIEMLFDIILVASFGLFALRAKPPLPNWSQGIVNQPAISPKMSETDYVRSGAPSYARSGLTKQDLERFAARLELKMKEGQLWRNHSLNLRSLAAEISLSSIHLSEVLNVHLETNFYDYINQHRIRESCQFLASTNQSVLEISELVGFNAKSTFNASFKKVTGQTPTQWRKRHKGP